MTPILCDAAIEGDIRRLLTEQGVPGEVTLEDGDILVRFLENLVRAHQVDEDSVLITVEGPISYTVWQERAVSGQRFPSQVVRAATLCGRYLSAEQLRVGCVAALSAAVPAEYGRVELLRLILRPCADTIPPLPRRQPSNWEVHVWLRYPTGWSASLVPSMEALSGILETHRNMWELVRAQLAGWDAAVADHAREVKP